MNTPDENRYEALRDRFPVEEPKTECCDCCLTQQEDVRLSPDEDGYTCVECIGKTFESSQAVKKFRQYTNHTEQELCDWFQKFKIS